MFKIQNVGSNYLARIIKLGEPRTHSNADKLICWNILYNNCITDKSYKQGDLVIYFPLESQLNKEFVSYFNGFQKKELNKDTNIRGYMDNNARVRAIKLRNEQSGGFIIKLEVFLQWITGKEYHKFLENYNLEDYINVDFDTCNWIAGKEILVCQKYTVPIRNSGQNIKKQKVARESRIVEGQFHFHPDTKHLKKELNVLKPDDLITIGYKMHGTSAVFSNILVKKKLNLAARILKKLGLEIIETEYAHVFSSRRVIKSDLD